MKRDFTDATKEELLAAVDEQYDVSQIGNPPSADNTVLDENIVSQINGPWAQAIMADTELIASNVQAKQEIEEIWANVYSIAINYTDKFNTLKDLATAIKEKITAMADALVVSEDGTGFGALDQLPSEFEEMFLEVDTKIQDAKVAVIYEDLVIRDEYGNIIGYDTEQIEEISGRDYDEISDAEYEALALVFIGEDCSLDEYEQEKAIELKKAYEEAHVAVQNIIINNCYDLTENGFSYQDFYGLDVVDVSTYEKNEKFDKLYEAICDVEQDYIEYMVSLEDYEKPYKLDLDRWKDIEQAKAVFTVLNDTGTLIEPSYRGENYSEYNYPIDLSTDNNGNIILNLIDVNDAAYGEIITDYVDGENVYSYENPRQQTITISPMEYDGEAQNKFVWDEFNQLLEDLGYAEVPDVGGNIIDSIVSDAESDIVSKLLEKGLNSSTAAGILMFIYEEGMSAEEAIAKYEKEQAKYDELFANYETLAMVDNYNLGVIQVETATQDGEYSNDYILVEGHGTAGETQSTQEIIDNVNHNTGRTGEDEITVEDVINQEEVVSQAEWEIMHLDHDNSSASMSDYYTGTVKQ